MFFSLMSVGWGQEIEWSQTFGESSFVENGKSVQQTSDGGYIVVGETRSFGNGGDDVCLIRVDSEGEFEWYRTFGGSEDDYGQSVQQTSDGGYIITGFSHSFSEYYLGLWLIKTNSNDGLAFVM